MIATLSGIVQAIRHDRVIVEIGGVGYETYVPRRTSTTFSVGQTRTLHTHLSMRQDSLQLFGFETEEELRFFETLITIANVGPKLALSLLSALTVAEIRGAVIRSDTMLLSSVPGVGRKTAARLLLELREKLALAEIALSADEGDIHEAARTALVNLGYTTRQASEAVRRLDADSLRTPEDAIRHALKILAEEST